MQLVDVCFRGGAAVISSDLNFGLTSKDWPTRYTVLKSFWTLLNTWLAPAEKPEIWRGGIDMDLTHLKSAGAQWERVLVEFYVQQAFNILGQPPSLPRRV